MESFLSKWRNEKSWIPVPGGRDSDSDIEKTLLENTSAETSSRGSLETGEIYTPRHSSNSRYARFPQGWLFLTAINLLMLVASLLNWKGIWRGLERNPCLKETSYYCMSRVPYSKRQLTLLAPILDAQDIALHEVRMNGTLFPPTDPSWSRLPFGDPVGEAMWESFERVPPFPITREQVVALGKDPETVARLEDDYWGMGDDMYIASLDIQHKVHCLNELRKMAFADFGDDAPKKKTHGQLWWIHLRHCTDMLAQDMLCHADADLVTYNVRTSHGSIFCHFFFLSQLCICPSFGNNSAPKSR